MTRSRPVPRSTVYATVASLGLATVPVLAQTGAPPGA